MSDNLISCALSTELPKYCEMDPPMWNFRLAITGFPVTRHKGGEAAHKNSRKGGRFRDLQPEFVPHPRLPIIARSPFVKPQVPVTKK